MTDFTYDSDDISAIKVASADLRSTQYSAFLGAILGLGIVVGAGWHKNGVNSLKRGMPYLMGASLGYSLVIYMSGRRHEATSSVINRKYSGLASSVLNYN